MRERERENWVDATKTKENVEKVVGGVRLFFFSCKFVVQVNLYLALFYLMNLLLTLMVREVVISVLIAQMIA